MFSVKHTRFGSIPCVVLSGPGCALRVAAGFGAAVLSLRLANTTLCRPPRSSRELTHSRRFAGAILFPFPNRVRDGSYRWKNTRYQLARTERGHAIHGLVWDKVFTEVGSRASRTAASVTLRYSHTRSTGYPFACDLAVTYTLRRTALTMSFRVTNTGKQALPFGIGWHPYFSTQPDRCTLRMPRATRLLTDATRIPTGTSRATPASLVLRGVRLDDCFRTRAATMCFAQGSLSIRGADWPYVQVYTPSDRRSIALEPMTCAPDALNNGRGLRSLAPGRSWSGSFALRLQLTSKQNV